MKTIHLLPAALLLGTIVSCGGGSSSPNPTPTPTPAPTISSFTPTSGPTGTLVTINGANFTGATAVTLNGASATFTFVNSAQLTATVPATATSGTLTVTTPGGVATSTTPFTVTPTYATRLTYTDPASGWRFVKVSGTGSTSDPLILELRGPASPTVKGAAFYVDLGASKVAWHALNGAAYATASSNMAMTGATELQKDKLTGTELQVGTFKKTGAADPSLGVVRIAVKLKDATQSLGDIAGITVSKTLVLDGTAATTTPAIAFGSLKAE